MTGPNTTLTLAGYVFQDLEIPQSIHLGTTQVTKKHLLPGGIRVIDAMGPDDDDIAWEGLFLGASASDNARQLQQYAKDGSQQDLDWWNLSFTVIIKTFEITFERYYQVGYRVTLEVVQDLSLPPQQTQSDDVDDLMTADANNVYSSGQSLGFTIPSALPGPVASSLTIGSPSLNISVDADVGGIDLSGVADAMTTLRSTLQQTESFVNIAPAALSAVTQALSAQSTANQAAIAQCEAQLNVTGVGGMVAGVSDATAFLNFMTVAQQETQLIPLDNYTTRMQTNSSQDSV